MPQRLMPAALAAPSVYASSGPHPPQLTGLATVGGAPSLSRRSGAP